MLASSSRCWETSERHLRRLERASVLQRTAQVGASTMGVRGKVNTLNRLRKLQDECLRRLGVILRDCYDRVGYDTCK